MLNPDQQQTIVGKINRVEEEVRVIRGMIQKPELCADILAQLAEAESHLNKVSLTILEMHVETCVPDGVRKSEEEGKNRLAELVDIFDRFAK